MFWVDGYCSSGFGWMAVAAAVVRRDTIEHSENTFHLSERIGREGSLS